LISGNAHKRLSQTLKLQSAGGGKVAHFQFIGFLFGKITSQSRTNKSNCFCWDVFLEAEGGTGGIFCQI
jgi:hypothetical protein